MRDVSIDSDLRIRAGGSFIHSSKLPGWREISDLHEVFCIFDEDEVVAAIVHVGHCPRFGCRRVYWEVSRFLTSNPYYPAVLMLQLNSCRQELRRLKGKLPPP